MEHERFSAFVAPHTDAMARVASALVGVAGAVDAAQEAQPRAERPRGGYNDRGGYGGGYNDRGSSSGDWRRNDRDSDRGGYNGGYNDRPRRRDYNERGGDDY
jgi:hypothetical protein